MADNFVVEIPCAKCGTKLLVHKPMMVRVDNGAMSQVNLIPTWSTDERKCPVCKCINAPLFAPDIKFYWVALAPPEEKRIVEPSGEAVRKLAGGPR